MKRFALILLGCALIMGMSQCKKDNANTPNNEGVRITLTADSGQNSKTSFDGTTNFTWTSGADEYIYVGGSNHTVCLGVLSAKGNGTSLLKFEGTITAPDPDETLNFFYLGNGSHHHDQDFPTSVSFASQSGKLAEVTNHHIAIGKAEFKGEGAYTAKLEMAMAIAWFNTSEFAGSSIALSGEGISNQANIDYQHGTITASSVGNINLNDGVSENCYVALLPHSTDGPHTLTFTDGSAHSGSITFNSGIAAGDFYVSNPGPDASGLVVNPN